MFNIAMIGSREFVECQWDLIALDEIVRIETGDLEQKKTVRFVMRDMQYLDRAPVMGEKTE